MKNLNSASLLLAFVVLATPKLRADSLEDAAKRLGAHYYKGSEIERRVKWVIGKIPVQIQLSLTYGANFANVYTGGLLTYTLLF